MAYETEFTYLICNDQHSKQILFHLECVYVTFGPSQN
jgi:hypothetical protein